jgi:hypothetical protein
MFPNLSFPETYVGFADLEIEPFYFGLGFIKARLDQNRSMNFYDPELEAIVGPEEVHDHRYDFMSRIMAGALINEIYSAFIQPVAYTHTHAVWDATCIEGEKELIKGYATPILQNTMVLSAGSVYSMGMNQFHSVQSVTGAITCLVRQVVTKRTARVLRPIGEPPLCPYAKKFPKYELMKRIEKLYAKLHRGD